MDSPNGDPAAGTEKFDDLHYRELVSINVFDDVGGNSTEPLGEPRDLTLPRRTSLRPFPHISARRLDCGQFRLRT
ncbi:hypothetical protein QA640_39340 [Bradyrhizobium sp. CB82]|uniref:hypothetical protein n=1 Tax=Bradyrhizobium sp. CB82 TaxID=3039159 RepID=UPI0024B0BA44|nr:hypothetical protein [Bradyrhizobium sp. CB82]WFU40196.1 hypothetical protein QA640_39340 [Bradyrhizobium sp. CB82]